MKKIILYVFAIILLTPVFSSAQNTDGRCTGEIRTDPVAAQDCVNKAIAQGEALGYDMSCKVEQLGLAGFTDPTSGKDYILNGVCTVNGSQGHGAYLLAGFTAPAGSNAIIQSVNPGWDILRTELQYESAFAQCGGKAPYYVNGAYTCTAPAGALPVQPSASGSTKTTNSASGTAIANTAHQTIFASIQSMVQNILRNYDEYAKSTLGFSLNGVTTTSSSNTSSQCYVFSKNLSFGDSGNDVFALSYALKQGGFLSQTTSTFDTTVMTAVKRFQEAHATEILSVLGLTQGAGVVGEKTRNYLNTTCATPASISFPVSQSTTQQNSCVNNASVSGKKTGVYTYTLTKNTNGTYKVQLNNPAYSTPSDTHYVTANFSFNAKDALDLNRQNQAWFNYSPSSLPGTASGNTEYANIFGSFNNAYYDWDFLVKDLNAKIASCGTTSTVPTPIISSGNTTPSLNQIRYIKISVADWDTLPLALREITVLGPQNTVIKPAVITATDFNTIAYTVPANLSDGNENTLWMTQKTSGEDLQVVTYDLGKLTTVEKVKIMNYGLTDTRVFVIEVSSNGSSYQQIAEVRAHANAPIADKGIVWGVVSAASTVGPIQY